MKLNPNCSEAIFRLRTGKLNTSEKQELNKVISKLRDDKELWGDTYDSEKEIFGVKHIEISGDAPYHNGKEIEKRLKKLKFWEKLEIQKDEA